MSGRYEIRFSGSGGQGLILAGVIFAEAATIYDKKTAVRASRTGPRPAAARPSRRSSSPTR